MRGNDQEQPFEFETESGWCQVVKFQEFVSYDAAALKQFERRLAAQHAQVVDPTAKEPRNEDDDDSEDIDQLFAQGLFLVTAETWGEAAEPTAAQIRAYHWLTTHRSKIFQVLIDHARHYYIEHREGFRDFFNGEPQDRDLLLPALTSPQDLKRLMRLIEIEISEKTRDGVSLMTYRFDASWDLEEYWEVTLCGDQITSLESAPFPFTLPKDGGWEKLPISRNGLRFAEFTYRGLTTGTFTIDAQGVCSRQIWCPVCNGPEIEDPALITAIREAPSTHMLATLVHKLELSEWIRRSLIMVAPICLGLGWSWNPAFYWLGIAVSLIAGVVSYLDAGYRWTRWTWMGLLEAGLISFSFLPRRQARQLDDIPNWTWIGLFETFVWLSAAAITAAWMFIVVGASGNPILAPARGILLAFGMIQSAALIFVAVTDFSALHLLWFTPVALLLTVITGFRRFQRSVQQTAKQTFGFDVNTGDMDQKAGGLEDAWRQMLKNMERRNPTSNASGTVYEAPRRPRQDRLGDDD